MKEKQILIVFYLDWVNNFITYEKMAEYYGISVEEVEIMVDAGRKLNDLQ